MARVRPNRLIRETSPYLLQHAENPVDWYPWGEEALELAERLDKPILLSIGYSACHWCHVMERESFEDEAIAELMNENFVCIKVDREERPDLDDIYMTATLAINGSGGWPMTVFLTPEQTPFFAGTYFPPEDVQGRPGFPTLLARIAQLWADDRNALFRQASELTEHVKKRAEPSPPRDVDARLIDRAVASLRETFDERHGGFGSAPKFPPCASLQLLMRHLTATGEEGSAKLVKKTLDAMKNGGLYDQLGGGFARYSTDERWLVPHFEKMFYDNAGLARVYLEAYQLFSDPEYARIARETLDYVVREMQLPEGGYASSSDADSEGVEGRFFVFAKGEIEGALTKEEAEAFCAFYDVTESGNWEGHNILNTPRSRAEVARELSLDEPAFDARIQHAREKVFALRATRVPPALDDKALASWNGLMIGAMAEGYRILRDERYRESATRAAAFVCTTLARDDDRLLRTARAGEAHIDAYLEDHAYLCEGLLTLYEATGDERWFERCLAWARRAVSDFHDEKSGSFFQTSKHHEALIVRMRDGQDGALPNPSAILASVLLRLGRHLDDSELLGVARHAVRAYGFELARAPRAFVSTLVTLDGLLEPPVEIVLAKDSDGRLASAVGRRFLPNRVIAHAPPSPPAASSPLARSPLLQGKWDANQATAYVCHHFHCEAPSLTEAELLAALDRVGERTRKERQKVLKLPRIPGKATAAGTARYFERLSLPMTARRAVADTQLSSGRLGIGGYGIDNQTPEHYRAVELALRSGCNVIDTAGAYTLGQSELTIGEVLGGAIRQGYVARDELIVMTKLGLVPRASSIDTSDVETTTLDEEVEASFDPKLLERQLEASTARLNLERIDVALLHNPELMLQKVPRETLLTDLEQALSWLQRRVDRGALTLCGVSSNLSTRPSESALSLEEVLGVARNAGCHAFKILQLPLNPAKLGPLEEDSGASLLDRAAEAGLFVAVQRPLSALVGPERVSFVDAPEGASTVEAEDAKAVVRALETEFQSRLGRVLQAAASSAVKPGDLFKWAERIPDTMSTSREIWDEFERHQLGPELMHVLGAMDRAFRSNRLEPLWRDFRKRYTEALEGWLLALRERAAKRSNERNRPVGDVFRTDAPKRLADAALSQHVLWNTSSLANVGCTLVGMRSTAHVSSAITTLGWPEAAEPAATLKRAGEALNLR